MEAADTARRLILENEFAELWFHPAAGIVHHQLRKFIWGAAYRQVLNEGLDALVCEGAKKWLSDNHLDSVHERADTDWCITDWFPRAAKVGWKYWAVVPPQNVIGQMNMERLVAAAAAHGVEARLFDDPLAAFAWLESVH